MASLPMMTSSVVMTVDVRLYEYDENGGTDCHEICSGLYANPKYYFLISFYCNNEVTDRKVVGYGVMMTPLSIIVFAFVMSSSGLMR
jgi:hypothetical protein